MIEPGVERQVALRQLPETLAPGQVAGLLGRRIVARVADARIGVPAGLVANALEAAVAGGDLGVEHVARLLAEAQVDMADDAGAGAQVPVEARRAHRRDAVGELGLADAAQLGRTVLAVHRVTVDEHGADDVVAGLRVGQQVVEQVVVAVALPEMVVRIDDRQIGLERGLAHLGDPGRVGVHHVAKAFGGLGHRFLRRRHS